MATKSPCTCGAILNRGSINYPHILDTQSDSKPPGAVSVAQALEMLFAGFHEKNTSAPIEEGLDATSPDHSSDMRRAGIDQKVDVIQVCLRTIHEEAARRTAALHKGRNATISIHKLPVEVLTHVFILAIDRHPSPFRRLAELSKVATNWWKTITHAPSLWTTIRADARGVGIALERSRNALLDVVVKVGASRIRLIRSPSFATTSSLVKGQTRRWRSVRIKSVLMPPLTDLLAEEAPLLESLDIYNTSLKDGLSPSMTLKSAPRLRSIRLTRATLSLPSPLAGLETLWIANLHVTLSTWTSDLLEALNCTPRLTSIEFAHIHPSENPADEVSTPPPPSPVPLPKLKKFRIDHIDSEIVCDLLEYIHVVEDLDVCTIFNAVDMHPDILQALIKPRTPDTLGARFMDAHPKEDVEIEFNRRSMAVGTVSNRYLLEFRNIHPDIIEEVAEIYGTLAPTWVSIQNHSAHKGPMSPSVLETLTQLRDLRIGRPADAWEVIEFISEIDCCPVLSTLHLEWEWDSNLCGDALNMDDFHATLTSLLESRPDLKVLDLDENSFASKDADTFLGLPSRFRED